MAHEGDEYLETGDLEEGIGRRAARGGALVTASRIVKGLLDVGTMVFLARQLRPIDFGLVGMVMAITRFVDVFKDLGLAAATVQRPKLTRAQVSALFWLNAASGAAIAAILVLSAPVIAAFFRQPRLVAITSVLAASVAITGLCVQHQALLKRRMEFGRLVVIEMVAAAVSAAVSVTLAILGMRYWALVAGTLALSATTTIATWIACRFRPMLPARTPGVGALVSFGAHLAGFNLLNFLSRNVDNVIVGRAFGAHVVALYEKAYELMMLPLRELNAPVASVMVPALSRLGDAAERYRDMYRRVLEKLLLVTMPLGALLVMTADWVIAIALGPQWSEAVDLFAILGCNVFTMPIANSTGWLLVTQNRGPQMLRLGLVATTTTILSFFAGLPWGAAGVAAGYTIGHLLRTPFVVWYVSRQGPVRPRDIWEPAWPMAIVGVACLLALWAMRRAWSPASDGVGLLVAIGVTIVVSWLALLSTPAGRSALADLRRVREILRPPGE